MIEFQEDEQFKEFMKKWDFPLSLDNPILRVSDKSKRVEFIREIARQGWNARKKLEKESNEN